MRFCAIDELDEDSTAADTQATVEAQEAANQQLYERALFLQSSGTDAEAAAAYRELLDQKLIAEAETQAGDTRSQDPDEEQRPSLHLRFLALKNLSELEEASSEILAWQPSTHTTGVPWSVSP